jgi:hypothetical protein
MSALILWGATASPFQLKMQALADAAGVSWLRAPEQVGTVKALAMALRLRRAQRAESVERFPQREVGLDEYPAVPFYTFDGKSFYYDSTGLAWHLEQRLPGATGLIPAEPAERFLRRENFLLRLHRPGLAPGTTRAGCNGSDTRGASRTLRLSIDRRGL